MEWELYRLNQINLVELHKYGSVRFRLSTPITLEETSWLFDNGYNYKDDEDNFFVDEEDDYNYDENGDFLLFNYIIYIKNE